MFHVRKRNRAPARAYDRDCEQGIAVVSQGSSESDRWLRVGRSLAIPVSELEWHAGPSGGPGGQHANRSSTKVEVRFDVANSPSLGPRQRARLLRRIGPVVRASAGDERSQARNRQIALERLGKRIAEGLRTERPRLPTAPSRGERERRLEDKRRRSDIKRQRQSKSDLD